MLALLEAPSEPGSPADDEQAAARSLLVQKARTLKSAQEAAHAAKAKQRAGFGYEFPYDTPSRPSSRFCAPTASTLLMRARGPPTPTMPTGWHRTSELLGTVCIGDAQPFTTALPPPGARAAAPKQNSHLHPLSRPCQGPFRDPDNAPGRVQRVDHVAGRVAGVTVRERARPAAPW